MRNIIFEQENDEQIIGVENETFKQEVKAVRGTIEPIENGVKITIYDDDGTVRTGCIYNGETGATGPQGPQGTPGRDGKDGKDAELTDNCIDTNHLKNEAVTEEKIESTFLEKIKNVRTVFTPSTQRVSVFDFETGIYDICDSFLLVFDEETENTIRIAKGSILSLRFFNNLRCFEGYVLNNLRTTDSSIYDNYYFKKEYSDSDIIVISPSEILFNLESLLNDVSEAIESRQPKNIYYQNLQIAVSDWVEEQEPVHEGYPYRCDVPVAESTVNHYPEPIFDDITERERKVFSKCETAAGILKIWAKEPVVATIETLKLEVSI